MFFLEIKLFALKVVFLLFLFSGMTYIFVPIGFAMELIDDREVIFNKGLVFKNPTVITRNRKTTLKQFLLLIYFMLFQRK